MFRFGNQSHPGPSRFDMRGPDRFRPAPQLPVSNKTSKISEPAGIQGHLDKLNQILTVVERTTPYIEEYGPFVKNLPQMYRMIKAFKSFEFEEETEASPENTGEQIEKTVQNEEADDTLDGDGLSKPKLFI